MTSALYFFLMAYLAAGRPILAIGPEFGDVNHLLESLGLQGAVGYTNEDEISAYIQKLFGERAEIDAFSAPNIDHLSRRHLAGDVAKVLNRIRDKKGQATTAF